MTRMGKTIPAEQPARFGESTNLVDRVAHAVLYEGYILYPYRATAVKNRQRFNFGGLYPPQFSRAQAGTDACSMQTECLVAATRRASLDVRVRFLHVLSREVRRLIEPLAELPAGLDAPCEIVESMDIDGRIFQTWQEVVEREVAVAGLSLRQLAAQSCCQPFTFPASCDQELLRNADGMIVGLLTRRQQEVVGAVEISADALAESLFRVRAVIANQTSLDAASAGREAALLRSLASTHTILNVHEGEFVSLFDPPAEHREAVASCRNVGTWPVLVGDAGQRDTLLSSPIILYDYPQIAPESTGDLFDGTEIDEILMLRIMTLTDEEKREMRCVDDRARDILERTDLMPPEQFMKLHGAVRGLRPSQGTAPSQESAPSQGTAP